MPKYYSYIPEISTLNPDDELMFNKTINQQTPQIQQLLSRGSAILSYHPTTQEITGVKMVKPYEKQGEWQQYVGGYPTGFQNYINTISPNVTFPQTAKSLENMYSQWLALGTPPGMRQPTAETPTEPITYRTPGTLEEEQEYNRSIQSYEDWLFDQDIFQASRETQAEYEQLKAQGLIPSKTQTPTTDTDSTDWITDFKNLIGGTGSQDYQSLLDAQNAAMAQDPVYQKQKTLLEQQRDAALASTGSQFDQAIQGTKDVGGRTRGTLNRILGRAGGFTTTAGGMALATQENQLTQQINKLEDAKARALAGVENAYMTGKLQAAKDARDNFNDINKQVQDAQQQRIDNYLKFIQVQQDEESNKLAAEKMQADIDSKGLTDDIKEYEYAVKYNDYQGTLGEWIAKEGKTETILTPTQYTQATKLARELYGTIRTKDQIEQFIDPIVKRMEAGETIDEIADSLRFAGQSPEFSGLVREAAQQITAKLSTKQTETVFDKIDDVLATGDISKLQDYLKKIAIDYSAGGTEQAKMIMGQERTVEFLEEIEDDLAAYEAAGGNTNIFTGTLEEMAKKVGAVRDAELRSIATKIMKARQQYRRSMTGVAFSPGENLEYDAIFPNINKTANFNSATITALKEAFTGDVDFFYRFAMGDDAYQQIFKEGTLEDNEYSGMSDTEFLDSFDFSQVGGDTKTAMRTDRHNNPTAFTTDIARLAGLKEGVDYSKGDPFSGGKYNTARLLKNPVDTTISVIDKIGFYTGAGKQRWTHTAISKDQWDNMSYNQKKKIVQDMYQKEGNQGQLNNYFT